MVTKKIIRQVKLPNTDLFSTYPVWYFLENEQFYYKTNRNMNVQHNRYRSESLFSTYMQVFKTGWGLRPA